MGAIYMELKDVLVQLVLGLILVLGVIIGGFSLLGYYLRDSGPGSYSVELDSFLEEEVN
jgi:hypothetical protein